MPCLSNSFSVLFFPTGPACSCCSASTHDPMNAETEQQAAYEVVLQKVGRNLLSFQLVELLLKELLRLGGFAVRSSGPEQSFGAMAKRVEAMTLGGLTTLFIETHCSLRDPVFPDLSDDSNEGMIAMSFAFNLGENGLEKRRESLATLVAERNRLVHHLLPGFDRDSLESCRATAIDLDRQREVVLPEIKHLQEDYRFVRQELGDLVTFMASPEGADRLRALPIQQHPLIEEFVGIARNNPAPQEWISLNAAAGRITAFSRNEIFEICASFGHKSLTALMIASRLFDIELDPAGNGRSRVLYRLKQDVR